jgi:hypothetical protein
MDIFFVCDATRMTINEHTLGSAATRSNLFACQSKKGTQELFTNNIYETFMVIYGHLRDAVGKGAGASFLFLT